MNSSNSKRNGVLSRTLPRSTSHLHQQHQQHQQHKNNHNNNNNNSNTFTLSPIQMYSPSNGNISMNHFVESPTDSNSNESRIIAPHVGKLAPSSVVEIRLQSLQEVVAVLCSVDV